MQRQLQCLSLWRPLLCLSTSHQHLLCLFVAPSQHLRPAYTAVAVSTGVNLDAEFVGSASQVVGSLPHGEVFAAPVFHQVHHVPLAGGGIPENLVDLPVVPEQVDFLRVVARRPPPLVDVMPSSRAHRHTVEHLADGAPSLPTLDVPVPQMLDQPVDILKIFAKLLPAVDEPGASAAGGTAGGSTDDRILLFVTADCGAARRHSSSWWWRLRSWSSRFSSRTEFNSVVLVLQETHF